FNGRELVDFLNFTNMLEIMFHHTHKLSNWFEKRLAIHSFHHHASWYTKGFRLSSEVRAALMRIETVTQLDDLFQDVDRSQPFPPSAMRVVRGKATGTQKVALPVGFLNNLNNDTPLESSDVEIGDGG